MWKGFMRRLGRFVQRLFSKKRSYVGQHAKIYAVYDNDVNGEIVLNGVSLGKIESLDCFEKTDSPAILKRDVTWDKPITFGATLEEDAMEMLEKLANTSRTILPKRIKTKALIASVAAHQPYEYVAVDLSQLEERGIAHIITGITGSHQEAWEDKAGKPEGEIAEYLDSIAGEELVSTLIPGATLLYYEDFDVWEYEV